MKNYSLIGLIITVVFIVAILVLASLKAYFKLDAEAAKAIDQILLKVLLIGAILLVAFIGYVSKKKVEV